MFGTTDFASLPKAVKEKIHDLLGHFNIVLQMGTVTQVLPTDGYVDFLIRNNDLVSSLRNHVHQALRNKSWTTLSFMEQYLGLNIDEAEFFGQSAIHILAEHDPFIRGPSNHRHLHPHAKFLINYILDKSKINACDKKGYTYLHAACFVDNIEALRRFVRDVNIKTYVCSPLYIAAQNRHVDIVKFLLENGANPNRGHRVERSSPLHALARKRVCDCCVIHDDGQSIGPVDEIVDLLVACGAKIEARDRNGLRPLDLAVSNWDFELARALLRHGASIRTLRRNMSFDTDYEPDELRDYPIALHVVEMLRLLRSHGFVMDSWTRFKLLKFWLKVRGNDADFLIHEDKYTSEWALPKESAKNLSAIKNHLFMCKKFGLFINQKTVKYLYRKCCEYRLKADDSRNIRTHVAHWQSTCEVTKLRRIMLNQDISLYEICQMNYREGRSVLMKTDNWRLPALHGLKHLRMFVTTHVASILMRQEFELLVADLSTINCKLNFPYTVRRAIVKEIDDCELYRLCEQADEKGLKLRPSARWK